MAIFSIFQVLSVIVFGLYLIGILNNFWSDTENACEMTYMFEYPQFVRLKVPDNGKYPQYGLYAYSEGRFTEKARKMRFDGIPVLFLPGNVGSYKQVRSLASVALRKAISSSKHNFHFDYFTVDFNDEMSALFGGVLEGQTKFASACLQAILNIYKSNFRLENKPASVIVIGHSMGGVIARALLTYPENKSIVNLILTLASPHEFPVINMDVYFDRFYDRINEQWEMKSLNTTDLAPNPWHKKVFVSIGGGMRDIQVPSSMTLSSHSDINALATSIPGVWLSTDHLSIVWCKQLILVLNRFFFAIVDSSTKQITADTSRIIDMGKYYLKSGQYVNQHYHNTSAEFIPDAEWHEDNRRVYSVVHENGVRKTWYYMIRLLNLPDYEMASIEVVDSEDKEWIFGCQAKYVHGQHRICKNGRHLSHFSQWTPSKVGKRRIAQLDLKSLRLSYPHWSHVIVRVSPTDKPIKVNIDTYNKASRNIQANIPAMYNVARRTIISETQPNALQYNISLPGFEMLYQAYILYIEPKGACQGANHASVKMSIPWADGHECYHIFTESQKNPMRLRLMKGNPNTKNSTQHVSLLLTLEPMCTYSVSIVASPYDALGQFSRHYTMSLPSYIAAVALLVLRHWASSMEPSSNGGQVVGSSFHSALCGENVKPYYLILSARLGTMIFVSVPLLAKIAPALQIGASTSQNFLLLPLLLFVIALGMMHILGAVLWCLLIFSGQLAHKILLRLVAVGRGGGFRLWDWAASGLSKAPGVGGTILITLATASCGAVALTTGAAFYFFLLTKMYEDYLEDLVYKTIAKVTQKIRGKSTLVNEDSESSKTKDIVKDSSSKEDMKEADIGDDSKVVALPETKDSTVFEDRASTSKAADVEIDDKDSCKEDKQHAIKQKEDSSKDETSGDLKDSNTTDSSKQLAIPEKLSGKDVALVNNLDKETDKANQSTNETLSKDIKENEFSLSPLHFHFAMFFLWFIVTLLNVPTLLTWAHNYKYSKILNPDPSFIPSLIMCASAAILWQIEAPKINILYYDAVKKIVYVTAVVVIMATPLALFRLNYMLSGVFAFITLHQMLGFKARLPLSTSNDETPTSRTNNEEPAGSKEEPSGSSQRHKVSSSLLEEESDMEKFRNLKEKIEAEETELFPAEGDKK